MHQSLSNYHSPVLQLYGDWADTIVSWSVELYGDFTGLYQKTSRKVSMKILVAEGMS